MYICRCIYADVYFDFYYYNNKKNNKNYKNNKNNNIKCLWIIL